MPSVLIYDYGGNTGSLQRALKRLGVSVTVGRDYRAAGYRCATHTILPGQGRFATAAARTLHDCVVSPILGICLGMQVLMEGSEEDEGFGGFGVFPGRCAKLPASPLPHIGWNTIEGYGDFYFCHSYAVLESPDAIGWTEYKGCRFVSLMERGNIWGIQAHPEKSGDAGMDYLERFLNL